VCIRLFLTNFKLQDDTYEAVSHCRQGRNIPKLVPLRLPRDTIHKKTPSSNFSIFVPLHTFFGIFFYKIKTYDPDLPQEPKNLKT
jgi:hypothetical protein